MAVHDYHDALPGYDERQIWHDGCGECEARGARIAIDMLDSTNFARAWERAAQWNRGSGLSLAVCSTEAPLLNVLWRIQVQLERQGWPLGVLPSAGVLLAASSAVSS
jgi:hypothetical protein